MVKRAIGFILYLLSFALISVGAVMFVLNLTLSSIKLAEKNSADFVTPLVMIVVGYVCRLIGQRLQRIHD